MSLATITLLAAVSLATPPATGAPVGDAAAAAPEASLPEGEARARYALKVMGQTIGEPIIQMGPIQTLKSGRAVRKMLFNSGISERLQRLYPADTKFVAVLDANDYKPLHTSYDILNGDERRKVVLKFKGSKVSADKVTDGKPERSEDKYERGMTDTISSLAWVSARGVKQGETVSSPHHSGNFRYRVYITGEEYEEQTVPAGTFRSLRVRFRLYLWPEGTKEAPRDAWPENMEPYSVWTIWITDDPWRTPVRITAEVGVLGNIDLQLKSRRLK